MNNNQGFNGFIHFASGDSSGDTATWTFSGVTPGRQYLVSAAWTPASNRATDAPFTVSGIAPMPVSVSVNQQIGPSQRQVSGHLFDDLGVFTADGSGTLVVTLSDMANGVVIADAVRIDPLLIINNEDPAPQYTSMGSFSTFSGQGRQGSMQAVANNVAASTATFTFSNLAPGSTYRVSATWPEFANRATNAPFTVSGVEGGPVTVEINQELAPDDYDAENSLWQDLGGPYTVDGGGTLTVTLTNVGANEFVVADAIRLQPLAAQPEITEADSMMADVPDGGTAAVGTTVVGTAVTASKMWTSSLLAGNPN